MNDRRHLETWSERGNGESKAVPALRVLELFCGIGGLAAALQGTGAKIVEAVDINHHALRVVRQNFAHPTRIQNLESVTPSFLHDLEADLWWMSPPCQPFTRRGNAKDDEDPRSRPFLHLVHAVATVRPRCLALENVPQFHTSRSRDVLHATLLANGYDVREQLLCPTSLGIPNRRLRYYLIASRQGLPPSHEDALPRPRRLPLQAFLDRDPSDDLALEAEILERYRPALHVAEPGDPFALSHCFTSSYGRSPVRSGSYLATAGGVRRFSPEEVLRLLGFPSGFAFPDAMPRSARWRLVGNSLSVPAVRHVLTAMLGIQWFKS